MPDLLALTRKLWATEPARVVAVLTAVIVFGATRAGVVLPELSVVHALELALPILLGGEAIRSQVSPAR